jgi:hypothetical protein
VSVLNKSSVLFLWHEYGTVGSGEHMQSGPQEKVQTARAEAVRPTIIYRQETWV